MSAHVLHGLEGADRVPELLADLGVGDGRVEHRLAHPEAVARDGDGGTVEQALDGRLRVTGELVHRRLGNFDAVRGHQRQPTGSVEHGLHLDTEPRRVRFDSYDCQHLAVIRIG